MKNGNQEGHPNEPPTNAKNIGDGKNFIPDLPKINVKCESCGKIHEVKRTKEIPKTCKWISCNWCPSCEDDATDYYTETFMDHDEFKEEDPNQIKLEL